MNLDLPTLMAVESFVAALGGLVILLGCPRGHDSAKPLVGSSENTTAAGRALPTFYSLARTASRWSSRPISLSH